MIWLVVSVTQDKGDAYEGVTTECMFLDLSLKMTVVGFEWVFLIHFTKTVQHNNKSSENLFKPLRQKRASHNEHEHGGITTLKEIRSR